MWDSILYHHPSSSEMLPSSINPACVWQGLGTAGSLRDSTLAELTMKQDLAVPICLILKGKTLH